MSLLLWNYLLFDFFENAESEFLTEYLLAFENQMIIAFSFLYTLAGINPHKIAAALKFFAIFGPNFAFTLLLERARIGTLDHPKSGGKQLLLQT